ncbi:MAG: hypothetical protein EHM60_05845 [Lysobacterales bacterium]|nr:MAG: hypothetical protein EHM60_05845 [Xanthomonadales bacterium]
MRQRAPYDVRILYREMLVVEQHLDSGRELSGRAIEHGIEHPRRFGKHEVRYPRASFDEGFRRGHLFRIAPR